MLDRCSLPEGWTAQYDEGTARRYYVHASSDITVWEHPNIAYYRGVVFMENGGLAQLMESIESDPPPAPDIQEMADFLGIRDDDDKVVREVAMLSCCAPLPPSYSECETSSGALLFR
jgi:hypothetical protein